MLFFGCRSASADHFFAEEWGKMVAGEMLTLYTAFSRDQPHKVLTMSCDLKNTGCHVIVGIHRSMCSTALRGKERKCGSG